MIFVEYNGFIIQETENAIALGTKKHGSRSDVEYWLPKSQIGHITYTGGDNKLIFINERIEAIEMPEWLAKEKGLAT